MLILPEVAESDAKQKQYTDEFKEQILKKCQETGNVALVARTHEISPNTIHTWHIKSFYAIKEDECYSRHEFIEFEDVYDIVSYY